VVFLRVVFLAAGLRAAVFLLLVAFFAATLRLAVVFLAALLRRLVAFFAPTLRLAEATFLLAVAFFAAVLRFAEATFLLTVAFFAAVLRFAVDLFFAGDIGHPLSSVSGRHAFQASPFSFAHPSPHPVPLIATKGVVEALDANRTIGADPLRLPR
jgi:hypothetical protein